MSGYRVTPIRDQDWEDGEGVGGYWRFGISEMQGWRLDMEDTYIAMPDFDVKEHIGLFAVFDGHGGAAIAEMVSEELPWILRSLPAYEEGRYEDALYETFLKMDEYLDSKGGRSEFERRTGRAKRLKREALQRQQLGIAAPVDEDPLWASARAWWEAPGPEGMGCTAVVTLVKGGANPQIFVANAGDSRCILAQSFDIAPGFGREPGVTMVAKPLTEDHKPHCHEERQRIIDAGGFVSTCGRVDGNLNLSRAFGDFLYKQNCQKSPAEQEITCAPEIRTAQIEANDRFILLGCDGIWDKASNQEVLDFIHRKMSVEPDLSDACAAFLDHNLAATISSDQGMGCDNMSLMIVDLWNHRNSKAAKKKEKRKVERVQRVTKQRPTSSRVKCPPYSLGIGAPFYRLRLLSALVAALPHSKARSRSKRKRRQL